MIKGMLGKKLGMTSLFGSNGEYIPVTVIEAGPCRITQVKTKATDGYNALQLGFGLKKKTRVNKPVQGHFDKSGGECYAFLREFRVENPGDFEIGQTIALDHEIFSVGDRIDISGKNKGRGFSGVTKRHGFSLGRKTHGSHNYRLPGSIGNSAWPAKVIKGKKMPGRYGNTRQTMRNLEVVDIRPELNLILVKGAVPGPVNATIEIKKPMGAKAAK